MPEPEEPVSVPPDVEEHCVDLGDVALTYRLGGAPDGPRVVVVSGSGSDLRQPPSVLDGPVAARCRILAYDHRGLGRSTPGPGQPSMADFAADLLALLDHVGWDTCRALGISFGGMVLQEAAVTEPGRFERLVLACTSPGGGGGASFPLHDLVGLSPDERRRAWVDALDVRNASDPERHALVADVVAGMDAARAAADGREPGTQTDGEVAQLRARAGHDTFDRLDRLAMPVLVAAGRYDGIAPPANQEAMAGRIPGAELAWFEGGHAFFIEDRSAWPAMADFLAA